MAVAQHEASSLSLTGLPGIFDPASPKLTSGYLTGWAPYTGVMAEAVQTVSITSRVAADNLLAIGTKGHAGYSHKFGGVDVNIDAVMTDNVNVSGAYGYQLSDFESKLGGKLVLITTNSSVGKKITVSGLYVNSMNFNFSANANVTTAWTLVGDDVLYEAWDVPTSGVVGNSSYSCVNPLTWDEIHLLNGCSGVSLTGVQSATFSATLNRTEIFQIGQFTPYDRSVTHPYVVTVSINTLANDVALVDWWDKFRTSYNPMDACLGGCGGVTIKVMTQPLASGAITREFIVASGLRPTTSTLNAAVGSNSTVVLNFEGTNLRF